MKAAREWRGIEMEDGIEKQRKKLLEVDERFQRKRIWGEKIAAFAALSILHGAQHREMEKEIGRKSRNKDAVKCLRSSIQLL